MHHADDQVMKVSQSKRALVVELKERQNPYVKERLGW